MHHYDVVIVGNGILGFSLAFNLSQKDKNLKIAVIGPDYLNGASVAAGAMLGCFGEVTASSLKSAPGVCKFNMALKSSALWPIWLEQINDFLPEHEKININPGTFIIHNSQAGQRETENYQTILKLLNQHQANYQIADPETIPGLNPVANHRPLQSIFLPDEGSINPQQLIQAFIAIANKHQLFSYFQTSVTELKQQRDEHCIHTQDGQIIHAKQLILSAGAYTQQLLKFYPGLEKLIPPILAGVGCSLILQHPQPEVRHVIRTPNRAGACGLHYLPYNLAQQQVFLGASNSVRMNTKSQANVANIAYLMQWGMQQIDQNLYKAGLAKINVGNRPVPFDTFPLIGSTPIPGLWIFTGTFRDGIHDSPFLAEMLSHEILFREKIFAHPFQPVRHLIEIYDKAEAIEEVVQHYLSAGYEHGMQLPKIGWEPRLQHMYKTWVSELYDRLECPFGLAPEIIMMLNQSPDSLPPIKHYLNNLYLACY